MRKLQKIRGRITGVGSPFAGNINGAGTGGGFMSGGALASPPTTIAPNPAPSAQVAAVSAPSVVAAPSHLQNSNTSATFGNRSPALGQRSRAIRRI